MEPAQEDRKPSLKTKWTCAYTLTAAAEKALQQELELARKQSNPSTFSFNNWCKSGKSGILEILSINTIGTHDNLSDIRTKYETAKVLNKHLFGAGLQGSNSSSTKQQNKTVSPARVQAPCTMSRAPNKQLNQQTKQTNNHGR